MNKVALVRHKKSPICQIAPTPNATPVVLDTRQKSRLPEKAKSAGMTPNPTISYCTKLTDFTAHEPHQKDGRGRRRNGPTWQPCLGLLLQIQPTTRRKMKEDGGRRLFNFFFFFSKSFL